MNTELTTPEPEDERRGLPSGSMADILVNCPGQQALRASMPSRTNEEPSSPEAERGTRIHLSRETGDTTDLQDETELQAYERGLELEKKLVSAWRTQFRIKDEPDQFNERRLWLLDDKGNPLSSARLDVGYIGTGLDRKTYALVCDWKTGRARTAGPASESWQLRWQTVLVYREFNPCHVRAAFVKPESGPGYYDYADYTEDVLPMWDYTIAYHLWLAKQSNMPRRAGRWCTYCPCKSFCPEVNIIAMFPSAITPDQGPEEQRIFQAIEAMSPEDLATVFHNKALIEKVMDAIVGATKSHAID